MVDQFAGNGTPRDFSKACAMFDMIDPKEQPIVLYHIGECYEIDGHQYGNYDEDKMSKAIDYYVKYIKTGDLEKRDYCKYRLAKLYYKRKDDNIDNCLKACKLMDEIKNDHYDIQNYFNEKTIKFGVFCKTVTDKNDEIQKLKEEVERLKAENYFLRYAPGGIEFLKCLKDFSKHTETLNNTKETTASSLYDTDNMPKPKILKV